jgi:hypothetical protein
MAARASVAPTGKRETGRESGRFFFRVRTP